MYLRFKSVFWQHPGYCSRGFFHNAYDLYYEGSMMPYDQERLKECLDWFEKHLDRPTRFNQLKYRNRRNRALCWFKDTAKEHLAYMFEISELLRDYGVEVEIVKQKNPGYVVYEDAFQIAAVPYSKEQASVI